MRRFQEKPLTRQLFRPHLGTIHHSPEVRKAEITYRRYSDFGVTINGMSPWELQQAIDRGEISLILDDRALSVTYGYPLSPDHEYIYPNVSRLLPAAAYRKR